jgi:hypothetical protein
MKNEGEQEVYVFDFHMGMMILFMRTGVPDGEYQLSIVKEICLAKIHSKANEICKINKASKKRLSTPLQYTFRPWVQICQFPGLGLSVDYNNKEASIIRC